jgi:hypothetical protein
MLRAVAEAWRYADITGFEYVSVGGKTALLRLSAAPSADGGVDGARPMLVADDGESVFRYVAIPAPADVGDQLRAAYSVPASLLTPDTVFSLEFDDDYVISLPEPVSGAGRVGRRAADPARQVPEPAALEAPVDATEDEPDTETPENDQSATAVIDDDATELDDGTDFDGDEDDAWGFVADEPADQQDRRSEMPLQVAALSAELADARRENAELRALAEQFLQSGRALREALLHQHVVLAETNAELTAVRDLRAATTDAPAGESDSGRLAELQSALDAAQAARDEAIAASEASATPDEKALRNAERERDELREQVRLMTLDREEADRQAVAFDGVAVKARERATEAEAEAHRAGARLSELEMWSTELERRLAEATTQLSHSKLIVESSESELRRLRGELAEAHAQSELDRAALDRAGVDAPPPPAPPPSSSTLWDSEPEGSDSDDPAAASTPAQRPASLQEIGEAAVAEAHALAERDLADAAS